MKTLTYGLLPVLLAACTVTPAQSPYQAGYIFKLEGVTSAKQIVQRNLTLRDNGKLEDGFWDYKANGLTTNSARVTIEKDFSFIIVVDNLNENLDNYFMCLLAPDLATPNWTKADGALVSGTLSEITESMQNLGRNSRGAAFMQSLKDIGGSCSITRSLI